MIPTEQKDVFINRYHVAGILYLLTGIGVGVALSGHTSQTLQTRGFFAMHAYLAFMGFGTLMVLGTQISLVPRLLGRRRFPSRGTAHFGFINFALWGIWAGFIVLERRPGNSGYLIIISCAALASLTIMAICVRLYRDTTGALAASLPLRFFATSIFMYLLAYPQLMHICINLAWPGTLPFSNTLALRHTYLALSFPISLTIMGAMYLPHDEALRAGRARNRLLPEIQYYMLCVGVFALFFSLLFDNPRMHELFATLQIVFSGMLLFSIMLLAVALLLSRAHTTGLPTEARCYYSFALIYLFIAGFAGFGLGYGLEPKSQMHYVLLQTHIHLALTGWAGLGLTGVLSQLSAMQGYTPPRTRAIFQAAASNAGIILMCVGIYMHNRDIRAIAGAMLGAAFYAMLLSAMEASSNARRSEITQNR